MKFSIFNLQFSILALTIVLAAVLRVWNIAGSPPGLTWDEAAIGYNAYSLVHTARDEYGKFLPLNFKSFGDYKPGVYIYADVPFVAFLGLNELAVRLPSVIAGTLLVFLVYLLVIELFENRNLALFCAFMLAISPLGIQFSRAAFESNLAVVLNCAGLLMFLKGLRKPKWFIFSGLLFGLSLFTYQGSRIFIPLFLAGFYLIYRKRVAFKKELQIGLGIFGLFILLMVYMVVFTKQSGRLEAMNFFAYRRSDEVISQISGEDSLITNDLTFQVLHGEWFSYTKGLVERYLIYFSPKMLFIDGDYSPRHRVPDLGSFYYFSVLLIPLGIIYLLRQRPKGFQVIFYWLAIGVIPGVLSRDLISMVRALNYVPPMTILEGIGLYVLFIKSFKLIKPFSYFFFISIFLILTFNFFIFLDRYFIHMPKEYSKFWLYGYKDLFALRCDQLYLVLAKPCLLPSEKGRQNIFIRENLAKYDKVFITTDYGQPYIYYLFYNKYSPQDFQRQAILDQPTVDVGTVRKIDNISFRHIYWPNDRAEKNSLFVGTLEELPDQDIKPYQQYKILKDINFLDREHAFRIVESR